MSLLARSLPLRTVRMKTNHINPYRLYAKASGNDRVQMYYREIIGGDTTTSGMAARRAAGRARGGRLGLGTGIALTSFAVGVGVFTVYNLRASTAGPIVEAFDT